MSYIHYSNSLNTSDNDEEKCKAPHIFKRGDDYYIIPFENINNLLGTKYRTTNFFTVCTTSNTNVPLIDGVSNFNLSKYNKYDDNILDGSPDQFIDNIMYIGNYNFYEAVTKANIFGQLNLGGKQLDKLDANMLFGGVNNVNYYPIFPLSCAFDIKNTITNSIYALDETDIKNEKGKDISSFITPPPPPAAAPVTKQEIYTFSGLSYTTKYSTPPTKYLGLLRRVLSGVSFGSQLAFFNIKDDYKSIKDNFDNTVVNQGYTVSIYGTDISSNNIKCGMTHYQIEDNKIKLQDQPLKDYKTQFDFSIGAKMLSLVVGCLISSADRSRQASNFYQAKYYTNDDGNKFSDGGKMDITGNALYGINNEYIDNNPGIPTIIPPSYMLKNIEKFTYYQNSNIFNYRPIKSKKDIFNPGKLFDKYSSMYDVGKSLLPIGGYYKNLDPVHNIDNITIEEGLKVLLEKNNITPNDIWKKQNGEIHETKDKIYLGVYKHSLLNNIITDNYDVLSGTANKYIKNLGELIIYISTLGVMLSWLSIYHYTTKGDYVGAVGTNDVYIKDVKMCYGQETLYPFSMDIKKIDEKYKIYPYKLNSKNIKDINNPVRLRDDDIIKEDGNINDKIMNWKYKINYNYGGVLTFIHNKDINNKISNIINSDNKNPYVTVDSKYTWRAPSLLYYSSDVDGPSFYDIINSEDKLKSDGVIIKSDDIKSNKLLNINAGNEKLFYINPLMYSINNTTSKDNIGYDDKFIKSSVNSTAYTKMLKTRETENTIDVNLIDTISLYNYGGVNTIQYMIKDNKTDFYEKYDTIYRNIQLKHDIYIKHSSIRGKSMIDFWRDLQLLPAYVDGLDFNIKTGLLDRTSWGYNPDCKPALRNIGGDNGLVTIGGGEMEIEYNEYDKIKSTSELIVQKILIKMGIKTSIRNYFNRVFNGKYLNTDNKKLGDLEDVDKLVDNVDVKDEDIENEDIYKPLRFYNNIKAKHIAPGLFHNDSIGKGEKAEILGGTLMSYTNIKIFVEKFGEMISDIDDFGDGQKEKLVKQYTRAIYKIHQVLFEVPLMNYKKDDYEDKLSVDGLAYYSKIETLIQSINTTGLTVYQTEDKTKQKEITQALEYTSGEIIPDLEFNLVKGTYIDNKYSLYGKTMLKDTKKRYTSKYMSLFNGRGDQQNDDSKRIIQKITVAHQKEFIDAFTTMINLSIIEYYGEDSSDEGPMYKKAKLLEKISKNNSDEYEYFFKLGLKEFEVDDLKFSKRGARYPKINIDEFFRIYYILQDTGNRSNGNIFSLDDYIRHHLNIPGDSVVTYDNQKYKTIIKEEFVKSNIGKFYDERIKTTLDNIEEYVKNIENDDRMKAIVEEIGEEIPLGCGTKFLDYPDNKVDITIAAYYNQLSSYQSFKKILDAKTGDIKKELLKDVAESVRSNRSNELEENIIKGEKELVQKIHDIYIKYNLDDLVATVGTSLKESIGHEIFEKVSNFAFIKNKNLKYKKQIGGDQTSNDLSEESLKIELLRLTYNELHEGTNLQQLKIEMENYNNEMEIFRNSQKKIITDIKRYLELRKKSTDRNLYYKEIQLNIFKQDEILVKMQKIINKYKEKVENILEGVITKLLYVESQKYTSNLLAPVSIFPSLSTLDQENKDIIAHFKKNILSVLEINKKIFADIINYLNRGTSIDIIRFESFYGSPDLTNYINQNEKYYGYYLNDKLYCDASSNHYDILCKQETNNPSGIWIIVESVTYPVRDRKILSNNVVYSLYDILTGRLIYCIGGLVRDNLYYKYNVNSSKQSLYKRIKELTKQTGEKLFGTEQQEKKIRLETFFYKIPEVYSFEEISGPILSISDPSIEGNNLYYLKIKLDPKCIFYKNGLVYFTPFSKRYIDLIKADFEYDLNLNIETDTESYLWYWNILELYKYIDKSSLLGTEVDTIRANFFKKYIEVDEELGNCISEEMRINVRRGLIDMYIQPRIDLRERATVNHSKLFKFEDLPGASSGPKVQYGTTDIMRLISDEDRARIATYALGLAPLASFDFKEKGDIRDKFIKIHDDLIEGQLSNICYIADQYNIQHFNTDSLSMLRKNPIFSYDGLKGYETIDACVWINRIKKPEMRKLFHGVLIKVDEYNELTPICKYLKRNNFVKNYVEEMATVFKKLYRNKSKINRDNKDPTMYLKLVFFTVLKYLEPNMTEEFIFYEEDEVLPIYKRVLFEIVFDNKITNFNNELMRQATKHIRNYLDDPVDIKLNLRNTVNKYLTINQTYIDTEIEIINKLIYDSNRDSNYYGKYLIILLTLYVSYEINKPTSGGAVAPPPGISQPGAQPRPPPSSSTPASSKQYGSSPFRSGVYKKIYKTEYWNIDATYLTKIFTTIKDQLILNRKHIAKEIGEELENNIYSPFNKCIIPRLFNNYDFVNNSSATCLSSKVYILGYETSSTKLTLDNIIVERYAEKYKIYNEINATINRVTMNLKKLIDKKTNTEELAMRNTQELKYITAKYRNIFELNYFKFLGKDLLKSLLELTEGAKVSFKEYFDKDIGLNYNENKPIIDKCLSTHKNMIYGNANKLNSYGYLNSMYLGVLLNIWGGNILFKKPLKYIIFDQQKYSEEIIWSYLVKVTWFLKGNMEEDIFQGSNSAISNSSIIKYHKDMWFYPGYNNYYIYYEESGIAARFLSCYKLILDTNEYIDNAYPGSSRAHINFGILHFDSNRKRHTESNIGALTEDGFKELITSKSGGSKQEIDYLYSGYNDYLEYGRYLMTNKRNDNEFNIYKKIKNKDIQSLDNLEKLIIKYRTKIERIEKMKKYKNIKI